MFWTKLKRVIKSGWVAFWRNMRSCQFVEESDGAEGSGVFMFRNLYALPGQTPAIDLTGGAKDDVKEKSKAVGAMATAMASSRNLDARRRLSHSAQLHALPILSEA